MRRNSPSEPPQALERDGLEVETTDGRRPAGAASDRMMVGLAALALLGGALIAITNALPDGPEEASRATASAEASQTPIPTFVMPVRTVQLVVEPLPSPPPESVRQPYDGWIRALEKVEIRSIPSRSGSMVATLRPGDAARVEELSEQLGGATRGWMRLVAPASGWIQPRIDGRSVIRRFPGVDRQGAGWIDQLAAGVDGFIGLGGVSTPDGDYAYRLFESADGADWRVGNTPDVRSGDLQVAHGPAGWLLTGTVDDGYDGSPIPWVWQSTDLDDWQLFGALPDLPGGVAQLVGSGAGYVALAGDGLSIWFSTDGLAWTERPNLLVRDTCCMRLTSTPLGLYLQNASREGGPAASQTAAFSPDGWTWSEVATDAMGTVLGLAAAGDQMVALERSSQGEGRAWIGTIRGSVLEWQEDVSASAAFDGAAITTIASDGQRPIAFGWERGSDRPLWWLRDGARWERHELPDGFGGPPQVAAGGSAGYVLLGARPSLAGDNPVIWHLTEAGTWEPERSPVIDFVADPPREDCGDAPRDVLELMAADSKWLAYCFGGRPLTFRAWSATCDECSYGEPGTYEPQWLAQPNNVLYLSPLANGTELSGWAIVGDWGFVEGVVSPSLGRRHATWEQSWLTVTGHFDDAASAACRGEPDVSEEDWFGRSAELVNQCRETFVITSVSVVQGSR
jgi:hypothetical protein